MLRLIEKEYPVKTAGEIYGRSPAMEAMADVRKLNLYWRRMHSPEAQRLQLCVGFWESRKVRGFAAIWFWAHNMHCQFQADIYREKLNRFITKGIN